MLSRRTVALFIASLLTACTTGERISSVRPGQSKEEVVKILGQPDGYQSAGEFEALKWANKLMSGWNWDRADYYVVLKNDHVVEYGAGTVRQNEGLNTTLVLIPTP